MSFYCSWWAPFSQFPLTPIHLPHWTHSNLSESHKCWSLHCFSHHPQLPISIEARPLELHRLQDPVLPNFLPHLLSSPTLEHPIVQRCWAPHFGNLLPLLPCSYSSLYTFPSHLPGFQSLSTKCRLFFKTFIHSLLLSPTPGKLSRFSQHLHNTLFISLA